MNDSLRRQLVTECLFSNENVKLLIVAFGVTSVADVQFGSVAFDEPNAR
jgi:hypothetical protein